MMKKIFQILFLSASLIAIVSCSDFLDENPKSQVTGVAYYTTEAQAVSNVNYLYWQGATRRITNAGSYIASSVSVNGMLTGYFVNSYEGQEVVCMYARNLTRQDHTNEISSTSDDIWNNCYFAINIANNAITFIPDIDMDATTATRLVNEAKFFRAFNYFYLVKTFGDVPLLLEPSSPENLYPERTSAATVFASIEADLTDALNLPEKTFVENGRRISKYVAAMMLADVYFYQGKYSQAKTAAAIVINSPHELVANSDLALGSAYNKLRQYDDLSESIYSQEFNSAITTAGARPCHAFSSSAVKLFSTYSIFERVYGPIDRFLNVYEADDLRIQPNQFFHWNYTHPVSGETWTAPNGQAGCWYYYDEDALLNTGRSAKDWNFYRLAEAYLTYAESIAQTDGVTADAAEYLARVMARANTTGQTKDQIKTSLLALSKQQFIETCWTERLREMPLEFKIWDDCVRTKKFPVISETVKGQVTYVDLIGAQNAAGATFKATDLYYPISLNELQRNPSLEQNEGYAKQ